MYNDGGYYQERRTLSVILAILVALFILGIPIVLIFAGFEPLLPVKNAILGVPNTTGLAQQPKSSTITDIKQPPVTPKTEPQPPPPKDTPALPKPEPQSPPSKTSPGTPISEKPPAISISELEKQVHNLINSERAKNGLQALTLDNELSIVARKHSEDMAKRNYFNHTSPEGYGAVDRCKQGNINISKNPGNGVYYLGCAENIFKCPLVKTYWYNRSGVLASAEYYSLSEMAEVAVQGWMNSKGHRDNILTKYWRAEGIGIATSDSGDVYITQDFN